MPAWFITSVMFVLVRCHWVCQNKLLWYLRIEMSCSVMPTMTHKVLIIKYEEHAVIIKRRWEVYYGACCFSAACLQRFLWVAGCVRPQTQLLDFTRVTHNTRLNLKKAKCRVEPATHRWLWDQLTLICIHRCPHSRDVAGIPSIYLPRPLWTIVWEFVLSLRLRSKLSKVP